MFDQGFFDKLLTTATQIKMWEEFAGENPITLPSANIITRDGATHPVRFNFGRMNDNEGLLYLAPYDVETDTSQLVCMPSARLSGRGL